MSDPLQAAITYFSKLNWPSTLIDQPRAVEVSHNWASVPFKSRAWLGGGGPIFLYDSICPERVVLERRAAVAEYLTRVNAGLLVGAYAMNWETGDVWLRTSVHMQGQAMTNAIISTAVYPNHRAMIDYLVHLMAVLEGEMGAAEAYIEARDTLG